MDFQKVLGASLAVQLVDVLGDDHEPAALPVQPGLTLGDGQVPGVGRPALHHLPPVVVELPHPGRVSGKGLRGGQVLGGDMGGGQGGKGALMLQKPGGHPLLAPLALCSQAAVRSRQGHTGQAGGLGPMRDPGEIGFNFSRDKAGKVQPLPPSTPVS